MKRASRRLIVVLSIVVIIIAVRLSLPFVLRGFINQKLNSSGIGGHVGRVTLGLLAGKIELGDINLSSANDLIRAKIGSAGVDLDLASLFRSKLRLNSWIKKGEVSITLVPQKMPSVKPSIPLWRRFEVFRRPRFEVQSFEIRDSKIIINPRPSSPAFEISNLFMKITGFTNEPRRGAPVSLDAIGISSGNGHLTIKGRAGPLKKPPVFETDMKLEGIELKRLAALTRWFAKIDFERGKLDFYAEAVSKQGLIEGYIKTVITDPQIIRWGERRNRRDFGRMLRESLAQVFGDLLEDPERKMIITKTPLSGDWEKVSLHVWEAIRSTIKNASGEPLPSGLDRDIGLEKHPKRN